MKVAILTLDFPPDVGGIQTYLYEVGRRLGETHSVSVITPVAGDLPPDIPITKVQPAPRNVVGFWRALRHIAPDHVIVGHAHPQLLMAAALYGWRQYATVTYGNDYLAAQQRWHRPFFNWLLGASTPLITITNANARRQQRLGLPTARVIYPGTDHTTFTPPKQRTASPPVLLTVSRLVPRKGIDLVLQTLPRLLPTYPDLTYKIAGSGPDHSRLEALAARLDIEHAVKFSGRVSNEALPELYREATIFVMPSREEPATASIEGFGIVYLEASASGLPVVAGRSGGAVEAVKHGETGYVVDPNDASELADVLLTLLQNKELRAKLGRAGRCWVEEEMNWDRTAREMAKTLGLH